MTSSGVSPKQLTVAQGTRVLFTDNDTRTREMTSDPHPEHTDCPEINNVGFISPGQTKETGNLNTDQDLRLPRPRESGRRPVPRDHHHPLVLSTFYFLLSTFYFPWPP